MTKLLLVWTLLAGATAAPVSAQPVSPVTKPAPRIAVADFAAQPTLSSPLLSPDGHWIAARGVIAGKPALVVINADDPNGTPLRVPVGNSVLADIHWAGSNKLLLTMGNIVVFYGIPFPMFSLVVFDRASQKVLPLRGLGVLAGDVLYVDPSGTWALVTSQNEFGSTPSVRRVDLQTGTTTLVERERSGVWDWYADAHGVVRGGLAYNDRKWTLWYRDVPGERLRPIRGKFDNDAGAVDRFIFGREDGTGAILTNEKTGRFAAYKYDFKTGSIGEALYENPQVDIGEMLVNPETGKIRAIRYEDDRWRTHWMDADLAALQAKLDHALPGEVNDIVSLSSDENRALILSSSASDPDTYYLLDRKAARMHPVIDVYERIDPKSLASVEAVTYAARDGLTIPAYLTFPRGKAAKSLPLIVMPHGGPFVRDDWEYDPLVQFLANRGYAVLQPQFRGSTGYGKTFVESGYGQWGRKMQDDLDDGVDWLVKSGKVDAKRVCIMGGSYGGYAALWGAIRNPERYRCAISYAGVSDLPAQIRDNRKSFSATRYFREWRTKVAGEGKVDLRAVSPITYAAQMKVPVLIAHGELDTVVAAKQSHAMVDALAKAKANVTPIFYKSAGHSWGNAADVEDFLKRLEAFLARYNPA